MDRVEFEISCDCKRPSKSVASTPAAGGGKSKRKVAVWGGFRSCTLNKAPHQTTTTKSVVMILYIWDLIVQVMHTQHNMAVQSI
jgi:hypothetical protein